MKFFNLCLIFLLCFENCLGLTTNVTYFQSQSYPSVLAHRGASGYFPESTLPGFEVAIYGDTDFVEMDVVLTKEFDLLVMHDPYLSRVTNIENFTEFSDRKTTRIVDNKTITDFFTDNFYLSELKLLSIRQALVKGRPTIFDYLFKAPSLDEFLQFMLKKNEERKSQNKRIIGVYLEAKNGNMYKELYGIEIGELLLKKLEEYGLADAYNASNYCPIVLQSFPIETTIYFHESGNNLPRIQLLNDGLYNYNLALVQNHAHGVGVSFPMIFKQDIHKKHIKKTGFIEKAHEMELKVMAYTFQDDYYCFAKNAAEMYLLAKNYLQLDAVFTEFFDVAVNVYRTEEEILKKPQK